MRSGVQQVSGDVSALDSVLAASQGCGDHPHGRAGRPMGSFDDYSRTNIGGTMAVLGACELNGIGKLVYTSTPSVVHAGHDIEGGSNQSLPYADPFQVALPGDQGGGGAARVVPT